MNAKQCLLLLSRASLGSAAHLQDFISSVVKANPAALLSSVGKDLSGDTGPVLHVYVCSAEGGRREPEKEARRVF